MRPTLPIDSSGTRAHIAALECFVSRNPGTDRSSYQNHACSDADEQHDQLCTEGCSPLMRGASVVLHLPVTSVRRRSCSYQYAFRPICICRGGSRVVVTCPNCALLKFVLGAPQMTLLNRLNASIRRSNLTPWVTPNVLAKLMFSLSSQSSRTSGCGAGHFRARRPA